MFGLLNLISFQWVKEFSRFVRSLKGGAKLFVNQFLCFLIYYFILHSGQVREKSNFQIQRREGKSSG